MPDDLGLRQRQHPNMDSHRSGRRVTPDDRRFLEMLVLWRDLYAARGSQDRSTIGSLTSIMTAANHQMRKRHLGPYDAQGSRPH
jgi:hypothetical protein